MLAGRIGLGSIVGADLDEIPANRRFYAGGGGSVRGYRYQSLSPTFLGRADRRPEPAGSLHRGTHQDHQHHRHRALRRCRHGLRVELSGLRRQHPLRRGSRPALLYGHWPHSPGCRCSRSIRDPATPPTPFTSESGRPSDDQDNSLPRPPVPDRRGRARRLLADGRPPEPGAERPGHPGKPDLASSLDADHAGHHRQHRGSLVLERRHPRYPHRGQGRRLAQSRPRPPGLEPHGAAARPPPGGRTHRRPASDPAPAAAGRGGGTCLRRADPARTAGPGDRRPLYTAGTGPRRADPRHRSPAVGARLRPARQPVRGARSHLRGPAPRCSGAAFHRSRLRAPDEPAVPGADASGTRRRYRCTA